MSNMGVTDMATTYEFVVETLDFYPGCESDPDIIDCPAFDNLDEAIAYASSCEELWRIVLRRDSGNDIEGITDRFYADPDEAGYLPERMETASGFKDGPVVPKRFRALTFPIDARLRTA